MVHVTWYEAYAWYTLDHYSWGFTVLRFVRYGTGYTLHNTRYMVMVHVTWYMAPGIYIVYGTRDMVRYIVLISRSHSVSFLIINSSYFFIQTNFDARFSV